MDPIPYRASAGDPNWSLNSVNPAFHLAKDYRMNVRQISLVEKSKILIGLTLQRQRSPLLQEPYSCVTHLAYASRSKAVDSRIKLKVAGNFKYLSLSLPVHREKKIIVTNEDRHIIDSVKIELWRRNREKLHFLVNSFPSLWTKLFTE